MLVKVSAFHVYSHDVDTDRDTVEHCTICNTLIENQELEFQDIDTPSLEIPTFVSGETYLNTYDNTFILLSRYSSYIHFGRPPPVTD